MLRAPEKFTGPEDLFDSRELVAHLADAPADLRALDTAPDALRLLRTLAVARPALLEAEAGMGSKLG